MEFFVAFGLAFLFSFIGSIPPATINLSVIQLGLEHKMSLAWRLALGASLIEYPYAWIAVKFETMITASPMVIENFHLISAFIMITLGVLNLWSANKPSKFTQKLNNSGFRRGLVLGILNPLAMPYWIGFTAYFRSEHWVELSTDFQLHSYLAGVSLGAFTLLILLASLGKRIASAFQQHSVLLKKIPGFAMLILGIYALIQYLIK